MTLQNNNNNIFEICFNIVYDDWEENKYSLYEILFEDYYFHGQVYINELQNKFIKQLLRQIFKSDHSINEVNHHVLKDMINRKRKEIRQTKSLLPILEEFLEEKPIIIDDSDED